MYTVELVISNQLNRQQSGGDDWAIFSDSVSENFLSLWSFFTLNIDLFYLYCMIFFKTFLLLKIYKKTLGEISLKRKNKRNFSICFSLSWSSLSLIRGSYFNKNLRKGKFQFLWLRHKMGCWQFLTNFVNFDNIYHVILRKKTFGGGRINFLSK